MGSEAEEAGLRLEEAAGGMLGTLGQNPKGTMGTACGEKPFKTLSENPVSKPNERQNNTFA